MISADQTNELAVKVQLSRSDIFYALVPKRLLNEQQTARLREMIRTYLSKNVHLSD